MLFWFSLSKVLQKWWLWNTSETLNYVEKNAFCAQKSRIFVYKWCFRFSCTAGIAVIFCFSLWGNSETSKKTKCHGKNEIKKQLLGSITINKAIKIEELNNPADKVEKWCCWHHHGIRRSSSSEKTGHHRGCILPRTDFQTLWGKGEVSKYGRRVKDLQEHDCV